MRMAASFLVLMLLAACSGTINTVSRDQPQGHPTIVPDRRIITDAHLNDYVEPVGVSESLAGDLTKIQVDVYNSQTDAAKFYYKFEWYDDQEMLVDTPMSIWTERSIQGGEQISLVAVAPTPKCKDFRLKLQMSPN